jgi:hypothetical protein
MASSKAKTKHAASWPAVIDEGGGKSLVRDGTLSWTVLERERDIRR